MTELFRRFSARIARGVGSPVSFALALVTVLLWAITGPIFGFSDTWQLVINTGTTIVTFLMVFLIQNTQNRDSAAIHLKLDELIRSHRSARNNFIIVDELEDVEMQKLNRDLRATAKQKP